MQLPSSETMAAIASAVAAIASALYAWRSSAIAKSALKIAEADFQEKKSGLQAYLIEGISIDNESQETITAFACTLSNHSSSPMSITRCDLHIHAWCDEEQIFEYILQPHMQATQDVWDSPPISIPLYLNAKETKSGWIAYKIPERIKKEMSIDKYEIQFMQAEGRKTSIETHLIQRIKNADSKD